MPADLNHDKLKTAFLAGRLDAQAQCGVQLPDGLEHLFRVILGEADVQALSVYSKVLFKPATAVERVPSAPQIEQEIRTMLREGSDKPMGGGGATPR